MDLCYIINRLTMLTPRQLLAIKLSWSYITSSLADFGESFYKNLFEMDSSLKPYFKNDMAKQNEKFAGMINYIISNIQHPENLEKDIKLLGQRHGGYGVAPEHYDTIIVAFLLTLKKKLKKKWDQETQEAWTMAFAHIAQKMKTAANKASKQTV